MGITTDFTETESREVVKSRLLQIVEHYHGPGYITSPNWQNVYDALMEVADESQTFDDGAFSADFTPKLNSLNNPPLGLQADFIEGEYRLRLGLESFSTISTFTRAGNGGYFDSDGNLQFASADVPRFDHNPADSNTALGLLISPQVTNRVLHSNDFTQGKSVSNLTLGSETVDARFGLIRTLTDSNDGGAVEHRLNVLPTGGQTSGTFGIREAILKAGTIRYVAFAASTLDTLASEASRLGRSAVFDLLNGTTVVGTGAAEAGMISLGGSWWYCWARDTNANSTTGNNRGWTIRPASGPNVADTEYQGDGTGTFEICHLCFREGATIRRPDLKPIITAASQVTRGADTMALTDLSEVLVPADQTAGGYLFARTPPTRPGSGEFFVLMQLDDGTENNRIRLQLSSNGNLRLVVTSGGAEQASLLLGTIAVNTNFVVAWRSETNDFAGRINGGSLVTDTSGTSPAGLTTLRYGQSTTGEHWGSTIAEMEVRETLSDAEIEDLVT